MRAVRLIAGLMVIASLPAFAAPVGEWLQKMDVAARQQNYIGTLVYGARGQMETIQVFHRAGPDRERERLMSLNGDVREMTRNGSEVTFVGSGDTPRIYGRDGAIPPFDSSQLQRALPFYQLIDGGADRVAGRAVQVIDVRARDAFRYSYRLWLDQKTGLLLKSVRHGVDGIPVELLMFTDVQIGREPSDAQLQASRTDNAVRVDASPIASVGADADTAINLARWDIADVPSGFERATVERDAAEPDEEHQIYSDGLASVSVYIAPAAADDGSIPVNTREGAVSVFSRQIGGYRVYVIGDVPELTAQRFAQGVTPRDG